MESRRRSPFNSLLRHYCPWACGGEAVWDAAHKAQYIENHEPWVDLKKKKFVEKYFATIVRETIKWTDDCTLFIFGYLVREFSQEVLKAKKLEKEIWVTSLFGVTLNVIKKTQGKTIIEERKEIL